MTDTEYYHTSSLATAAAAVEQGFEGLEAGVYPIMQEGYQWEKRVMNDKSKELLRCDFFCWRFPKTPHNVLLMDAQTDDIGLTNGIVLGKICEYHRYDNPPALVSQIDLLMSEGVASMRKGASEDFIIIYRNNKPFPVWDEEPEA